LRGLLKGPVNRDFHRLIVCFYPEDWAQKKDPQKIKKPGTLEKETPGPRKDLPANQISAGYFVTLTVCAAGSQPILYPNASAT
jgi:hypothetical protein